MRKLLTTTAMILALGASPALADGFNGHGNGNFGNGHGNNGHSNNGNFGHGPAQHEPAFKPSARFDRDMNAWERGWSPFRIDVRFGQHSLSKGQIMRRLAAQGYYRVYDLKPARFGSWRAVAAYRGRTVVLRVDQYSGRVIASRYI